MDKYTIITLTIFVSLIGVVSADSICDNAPCEKMINASVGKNFNISLESNPATGFGWWAQFDPQYLSLVNETSLQGSIGTGLAGVPGTEIFVFAPKKTGDTHVTMLYLQPWENGTIGEREIFPITVT